MGQVSQEHAAVHHAQPGKGMLLTAPFTQGHRSSLGRHLLWESSPEYKAEQKDFGVSPGQTPAPENTTTPYSTNKILPLVQLQPFQAKAAN